MKKDVSHLKVQFHNLNSYVHYTEPYVLDDVISISHMQAWGLITSFLPLQGFLNKSVLISRMLNLLKVVSQACSVLC